MAEDEGNSWVFDSLVCFLNGPVWNAPLQTFIEEKSLIFEPNVTDNEEYKNIFDEFKNLVDFMLGNFMEDIGISPEQFEEACSEGQRYHVTFDHSLFEVIWAANDFDTFNRMMTQRNVELQLQALELIEQKYGITPQSFIPKKKNEQTKEESMVIVEVESPNLEKQIMTEVAEKFSNEESSSKDEVQFILEEKQILQQSLEDVKEQATTSTPKIELVVKETPKPANNKVDGLELKKRQDYLRAQRDKLVALKKDVRKKQLVAENGAKGAANKRPKSAKAAEAVLTGEPVNVEPQKMQIRKSLAQRLKTEVVGKK